jgi:UDP-N-acetyl-D-glucosamine dehydrogenase
MPRYVVLHLSEELNIRFGRALKDARVLVLGVAYKKNVDDMRESPALVLMELLVRRGAEVDFHDPFVPVIPPLREHAEFSGKRSMPIDAEVVAGYDVVLIATDHDPVDYRMLQENARLIVDTRNACARAGVFGPNVTKA